MAVMSGAAITGLPAGAGAVNQAAQVDIQLRQDVIHAGDVVRRSETARMIANILKEVTKDRLRLGPFEQPASRAWSASRVAASPIRGAFSAPAR